MCMERKICEHTHNIRKDIQSYPIRPDEVNDWNCAAYRNIGNSVL